MEVLGIETFKNKIFDFSQNTEWKFNGPRPAIIDFYADWSGPCRALAPTLKNVAKKCEGKVDIYKVDPEASPELARFNLQYYASKDDYLSHSTLVFLSFSIEFPFCFRFSDSKSY